MLVLVRAGKEEEINVEERELEGCTLDLRGEGHFTAGHF